MKIHKACGSYETSLTENVCIIRIAEGKERELGVESLFLKILPKNFTNLGEI